tara:strand:+ start:1701 stop:1961 length:261 start_codon:yes stop_codon:yes gene_type:complete
VLVGFYRKKFWLDLQVILSVHDMRIAEHSGLPGIRNRDLLEYALARPGQIHPYNSDATLWQLGAAYALGISGIQPTFCTIREYGVI